MVSAIVKSACLRPFVRSSLSPEGVVVKGPDQLLPWGFLAAVLCVAARRGQPRSSSLRCGRSRLTAAARDGVGSDRGNPLLRSGPAVGVVAGLVSDHRVGDLVRAMCHCTTDHPALLAAGPQLLAVVSGGRVGMPQPDPEVDQRPPQSHTAFAADAAVATLARRLILRRRQTGGAVEWRAPGQRPGSPTAAP
jgi:hypothetical protein